MIPNKTSIETSYRLSVAGIKMETEYVVNTAPEKPYIDRAENIMPKYAIPAPAHAELVNYIKNQKDWEGLRNAIQKSLINFGWTLNGVIERMTEIIINVELLAQAFLNYKEADK